MIEDLGDGLVRWDGLLDDEPEGQRFWDKAGRREMVLIAPGREYAGWVAARGDDGRWWALRTPGLDDWKAIDSAQALGYLGRRP